MPPLLRVPDWSRGGGDGARAAGAEGTEVRWGGRDRARLLGLEKTGEALRNYLRISETCGPAH